MILILSHPADAHARKVAAILRDMRAEHLMFNHRDFPTSVELSLCYGQHGLSSRTLRIADRRIDLSEVRAIWYRRPEAPLASAQIDSPLARAWVVSESEHVLHDTWESIDCLWLPGRHSTQRRGEYKAAQLKRADELGFDIPPTLITNDPDALTAFHQAHGGRVVSKYAGQFHWRNEEARAFSRYTEPVSLQDMAHRADLRLCPMIFQAYVDKQVEIRVTVVSSKVFAAEIDSQASNRARHDWRRWDWRMVRYTPHALPGAVAARCVELVVAFGLTFGTIDLILTPEGKYVFLELNPNGQYLWVEDATGLPVSRAIAELLIQGGGQPEPPRNMTQTPTALVQ